MLFKGSSSGAPGQFRNVSLFTDASYNHRLHTLGGAWWAIFDGRKLRRQSRRRDVLTSAEAEIRVACGAIRQLLTHQEFCAWRAQSPIPVRLILVVDCLAIQDAFSGRSLRLAHWAEPTVALLEAEGITLKINHVKAHTGEDSPRSGVNRWCDKMAKAARKTLEGAPA